MNWLAKPNSAKVASRAVILIRLMVGGVFLVEGILKFMYPEALAGGRFAKIGFPAPGFMGIVVGIVETICGAAVLLGLFTRLAAVGLLIVISVAILSTKVPILLGHGFWGFSLSEHAHYGFLSMVHEARTDFSMWLGLVFLLIVGGGLWSVDSLLERRRQRAALANAEREVPHADKPEHGEGQERVKSSGPG